MFLVRFGVHARLIAGFVSFHGCLFCWVILNFIRVVARGLTPPYAPTLCGPVDETESTLSWFRRQRFSRPLHSVTRRRSSDAAPGQPATDAGYLRSHRDLPRSSRNRHFYGKCDCVPARCVIRMELIRV